MLSFVHRSKKALKTKGWKSQMDPFWEMLNSISGVAAKWVTKCDSFLIRALDRKEHYF